MVSFSCEVRFHLLSVLFSVPLVRASPQVAVRICPIVLLSSPFPLLLFLIRTLSRPPRSVVGVP